MNNRRSWYQNKQNSNLNNKIHKENQELVGKVVKIIYDERILGSQLTHQRIMEFSDRKCSLQEKSKININQKIKKLRKVNENWKIFGI